MPGVSSELASCYTLISNTLRCARKALVPEYWPALWKPLASALDTALFDAFCNPSATDECTQLSRSGERQFVEDIRSLVAMFAAGSSKPLPRSYFRLTREVCHLLEMPAARLREVYKALDDESTEEEVADGLEQLTTILEACGILRLHRPKSCGYAPLDWISKRGSYSAGFMNVMTPKHRLS